MTTECEHTYRIDHIKPARDDGRPGPNNVTMTCTKCDDTRTITTLKTRAEIEAEAHAHASASA